MCRWCVPHEAPARRAFVLMFVRGLMRAQGIKTALAADPWIPKSIAKAIEAPTIALIDEVLRRAQQAELEVGGRGAP